MKLLEVYPAYVDGFEIGNLEEYINESFEKYLGQHDLLDANILKYIISDI